MASNASDITITFLAAVPYHFHLQGRTQRLAWHLAEAGWDVRYVAPPTPRAMLRHWIAPWRHQRADKVRLLWPRPGLRERRSVRLSSRADRLQTIRLNRLLKTDRKHVLCASTPSWFPLLEGLHHDAVIYDCIDAPEVHVGRGSAAMYQQWHDQLCRRADGIVSVSEHLAGQLRTSTGRQVMLCHNGVDVDDFVQRSVSDVQGHVHMTPGADNWLSWRKHHAQAQVAGFIGSIDSWVDTELVARTARALSNVRFVVAGPCRNRKMSEPLESLPSVTLLGRLPYDLVPAVMRTFDVGLIPFKPGEVTASADPIKLYEHFALGQPVLATYPFRPDAVEAGLLEVAEGEAFKTRLQEMLSRTELPERAEQRRSFAARHDWRGLAGQFARCVISSITGMSS